MGTSRRSFLITCIAQVVGSILIVSAQVVLSLRQRIPKPDPKKYASIKDGSQWKNPYLIVGPEGIEIIVGVTRDGRRISLDSVVKALESLPDSAWPYGLVVAVSENGIVSPATTGDPQTEASQLGLIRLLKQQGIAVDLWPAA